jgi:hypothetical protein
MREDHEKDRKIAADVSTHLTSRGLRSPCRVAVTSIAGTVTLSGPIQYEHQRGLAMQVAKSVLNVRRVVDQMRVMPRVDQWKAKPPTPGEQTPAVLKDVAPPEPPRPYDPMRMPT